MPENSKSESGSHRIILSGFSDEAALDKTADQQFAVMAALGLSHLSLRFIDLGDGIKNAMGLSDAEVDRCVSALARYGLRVSSLGSPIGKIKLVDQEDGTKNRYVPFDQYLQTEVSHACRLARRLGTKLIRGFGFYHPKGSSPESHLTQVCDHLSQIVEVCQSHDLVFGLEVEANLVGQTGYLLAEIHRRVGQKHLVLIFDGANLSTQGFDRNEIYLQYQAMKPGLGWLHIKDYAHVREYERLAHVDEDALHGFVPVDQGGCGHEEIFRDLRDFLPTLQQRMQALDVEGVFLDLEPHVRGGGQFGGFSGPDGFGVALRSLTRLLDYRGIGYHLRGFEDLAH